MSTSRLDRKNEKMATVRDVKPNCCNARRGGKGDGATEAGEAEDEAQGACEPDYAPQKFSC